MSDERALEMASLLPERCYLILRQMDDENFSVTAYDTTEISDDDDEYIDATQVAIAGILELLENDFERVVSAGMARIEFNETAEAMIQEVDEDRKLVTEFRDGNIVKIDFGTKQ